MKPPQKRSAAIIGVISIGTLIITMSKPLITHVWRADTPNMCSNDHSRWRMHEKRHAVFFVPIAGATQHCASKLGIKNRLRVSNSDDIPRFKSLLEKREANQRFESTYPPLYDAWYHAPLRPKCVWPIFRNWIVGNSGFALRQTATIIPPGPDLLIWSEDDFSFASTLIPSSKFVVFGQWESPNSLRNRLDSYRITCRESAKWSTGLVCLNAPSISLERIEFVDCDTL